MGTEDAGWTTPVVVAAVVGMVAVLLLWLCGRCCRLIDVRRTIEVEASALFSFLCDPNNLALIHPYTTEIRVEEEREEEGGRRRIQFVWVEQVPFTAKSLVTLTSDPCTRTVVLDIRPAGSMFTVQLTWRCIDMSTDAADDTSTRKMTQDTRHSTLSAQASRDLNFTQDSRDTTAATETDDARLGKNDNHFSKEMTASLLHKAIRRLPGKGGHAQCLTIT